MSGLLLALLDIDEVIQVIRSSDDADVARARLMDVFDLSELQATYILELRLRRLTRLSRLELERERDQLGADIEALRALRDDPQLLRTTVSDELAAVATTYGTPRRTVLLEASGVVRPASAPLEVTDDPCWALLSATGLLARTAADELAGGDGRAAHDVIRSVVRTTARGEVAVVTSHGRMLRLGVIDLPAIPATAGPLSLSGGAPISEFLGLAAGERVLALSSLRAGRPRRRARHRAGRGEAGDAGLPRQPRRLGADRAQGRRRGRRRGRARDRRRGPGVRHRRRPAAAFPGVRRASAGPGRRRHGRHPARCGRPGDVLRRGRRRSRQDAVVVTIAGSGGALPGHRDRAR